MRGARGARALVRGGEVRARPLHSVECRVCSVCDLREADIDEGPMGVNSKITVKREAPGSSRAYDYDDC